jgi:hypothetical protein
MILTYYQQQNRQWHNRPADRLNSSKAEALEPLHILP